MFCEAWQPKWHEMVRVKYLHSQFYGGKVCREVDIGMAASRVLRHVR